MKTLLVCALTLISLTAIFTLLVAAEAVPLPGTDVYQYTMAQQISNSYPYANSNDTIEGIIQVDFRAGNFFSAPDVGCTVSAYDKTPWLGDVSFYLEGTLTMKDGSVYEDYVTGVGQQYLKVQSALWKYPDGARNYAIATNEAADAASVLVEGVGT